MRTIKTIEEKYLNPTLDLVEQVFTAHSDAEEGALVRALVEEIRSKRFYLPELELVMVDENDCPIGYAISPGSIWAVSMRTSCCFCPPWR